MLIVLHRKKKLKKKRNHIVVSRFYVTIPVHLPVLMITLSEFFFHCPNSSKNGKKLTFSLSSSHSDFNTHGVHLIRRSVRFKQGAEIYFRLTANIFKKSTSFHALFSVFSSVTPLFDARILIMKLQPLIWYNFREKFIIRSIVK